MGDDLAWVAMAHGMGGGYDWRVEGALSRHCDEQGSRRLAALLTTCCACAFKTKMRLHQPPPCNHTSSSSPPSTPDPRGAAGAALPPAAAAPDRDGAVWRRRRRFGVCARIPGASGRGAPGAARRAWCAFYVCVCVCVDCFVFRSALHACTAWTGRGLAFGTHVTTHGDSPT